jgi:hypothetical protein
VDEHDLYPDLVGRGLSAALQVELDAIGADLTASWEIEPLAWWSGVERGSRMAQVAATAEERGFTFSLWGGGVERIYGYTNDLHQVAATIADWLGDEQLNGTAISARHPFLEQSPLDAADERGEAVEYLWQRLLDAPPFDGMVPLVEAAAEEPRLRRLPPWTSFDRLSFSRGIGMEGSEEFPYAAPRDGCFRVWRPSVDEYLPEREEDLLGEGDAARAVGLLVDALPE